MHTAAQPKGLFDKDSQWIASRSRSHRTVNLVRQMRTAQSTFMLLPSIHAAYLHLDSQVFSSGNVSKCTSGGWLGSCRLLAGSSLALVTLAECCALLHDEAVKPPDR